MRIPVLALGILAISPAIYAAEMTAPEERALVDKYCVTCHNEKLKTGGLVLDKTDTNRIGDGAETWEKVVRKIHGGTMPPLGMPRPDAATLDNFAASLEAQLDRAAVGHSEPGRASIHRLNRAEYSNDSRDLLSLKVDVTSLLPADDESNGFDNIADVLKVSPSLLEQYLGASRTVASLAVGHRGLGPVSEV